MNAASWDASNDPLEMIGFLLGDCSVRQKGFWSIACLLRVADLLSSVDRELIAEVEGSLERTDYLVGEIEREKWKGVVGLRYEWRSHIQRALNSLMWSGGGSDVAGYIADAIAEQETGFTGSANWPLGYREIWRREQAVHANLLREVRGNPYRPVTFLTSWRSSGVSLLAQNIYDTRDFSALPILADALQDAGCHSDELLNHLRDPHETHVRGCWALDLVLGKVV